jgi:predicted ATPase
VVLCVDDVHLLDDLSAFVLHQIVQRRAAKVVVTVGDREPIPAGIQEVCRVGQFDRLDLQALSRDETMTLLSATLGASMDPDAAHRLWKLTRGNVLYLCNIVEHEVADGRLAREHDYWTWTGDPIVPPGLVELIESRIGALPARVSDVIDALAVGEPIELASLRRIADPAAVEAAGFTDADHARVAFLRATNMLWTLADPAGAKEHIDAAAQTISRAEGSITAFLTVYWAAMASRKSPAHYRMTLPWTSYLTSLVP